MLLMPFNPLPDSPQPLQATTLGFLTPCSLAVDLYDSKECSPVLLMPFYPLPDSPQPTQAAILEHVIISFGDGFVLQR